MASLMRHSFAEVPPLVAIIVAILATKGATCPLPRFADTILGCVGRCGIHADLNSAAALI